LSYYRYKIVLKFIIFFKYIIYKYLLYLYGIYTHIYMYIFSIKNLQMNKKKYFKNYMAAAAVNNIGNKYLPFASLLNLYERRMYTHR